ncbi:MAG TPA: MFS transporter, partial [Pyrinomonadaceae bacterium]
PPILNEKFGVNISAIAVPLIVIYVIADIGSIGGGYLSSALIKSGRSVNQSRKLAMLICALCVVPVVFVPFTNSLLTAVLLISLAAAAHQGWSANIFTTASDMFPRQAVGSVVGFGGMVGSVGGVILQATVGYVKDYTGSYLPVFFIAASAYLIALAAMQILTPKLEPAVIDTE